MKSSNGVASYPDEIKSESDTERNYRFAKERRQFQLFRKVEGIMNATNGEIGEAFLAYSAELTRRAKRAEAFARAVDRLPIADQL